MLDLYLLVIAHCFMDSVVILRCQGHTPGLCLNTIGTSAQFNPPVFPKNCVYTMPARLGHSMARIRGP